jgi:D-arabinose 1-dehydrogenase-like Zn-dependent alcohol dehydrogenase
VLNQSPTPLRRLNVGKGHKVGVLGLGGLGHMSSLQLFGAEVTKAIRHRKRQMLKN